MVMTDHSTARALVEKIPSKLSHYIDAAKMTPKQLGIWVERFVHDHSDTTGYGWDNRWKAQRIREMLDFIEQALTPPEGDTLSLRAALEECADKLWVIHFGLKDDAEREAAINACNMATAALQSRPCDTSSDEVVERVAKAIMEDRIARMGADPSNWAVNDALRNDARAAIAALQSRVSPQENSVELRHKMRMIISHASGGYLSEPEDIDRSTNDISEGKEEY